MIECLSSNKAPFYFTRTLRKLKIRQGKGEKYAHLSLLTTHFLLPLKGLGAIKSQKASSGRTAPFVFQMRNLKDGSAAKKKRKKVYK